jgi:hypothetical protein
VGDLAARPRGGWQFGNRPRSSKKAERPRDEQGRLLLPNGSIDDAPQDCWGVTRFADRPGYFELRHYLDQEQARACCRMSITRSAGDVAQALVEGIDVDIVTMRRAPDCVNTKRTQRKPEVTAMDIREVRPTAHARRRSTAGVN